jgi:hypothetical protein
MAVTVSNGARKEAARLELDVDAIAARHAGPLLGVQDVLTFAEQRGLLPAAPQRAKQSTPSARQSAPAAAEAAREQRVAGRQGRTPEAATTPAAPARPTAAPRPWPVGGSEDPLMLDGCKICVQWPHKGATRARVGIVRFRPLPGKRRRYVVMLERCGGGVRERKTNWCKLKRRSYEVVASARKAGYAWEDAEKEAAKRRRLAPVPESMKSIGVALGRPSKSVHSKLKKLLDPAYEAQPGGSAGKRRQLVGWREVVQRAMEQLPERRGTAKDICAKVAALPGVTLDWSVSPGKKSVLSWEERVAHGLSRHPEFSQTDERAPNAAYDPAANASNASKTLAVWQYTPPVPRAPPQRTKKELHHLLHGPKRPSQASATKKQLNTVKAFRK